MLWMLYLGTQVYTCYCNILFCCMKYVMEEVWWKLSWNSNLICFGLNLPPQNENKQWVFKKCYHFPAIVLLKKCCHSHYFALIKIWKTFLCEALTITLLYLDFDILMNHWPVSQFCACPFKTVFQTWLLFFLGIKRMASLCWCCYLQKNKKWSRWHPYCNTSVYLHVSQNKEMK